MTNTPTRPRYHSPPVPDEIRIPISEFVEIHGSTGAARLLGVSETALLRIVATGRSPLGTQARLRLILAKRARDAVAAAGLDVAPARRFIA